MRKIPCLLFALLPAISFFGQKKEIGVKLGLTADRFLTSGYSEGFSSTLFYSGRIIGNLWVGKKIFLSGGIDYGNTGSKLKYRPYDQFTEPGEWLYQLKQITVPVSMNFALDRKKKFSLGAGIFGGYLINGSKKFKARGNDNWGQKTDISDQYKKFNYGLHLNTNYKIRLTKNKILELGLEEELGLKNLYEQYPESKLFTQSFGLHAGLQISM